MRFKNNTNGKVSYYGFDDHGYKAWQVLQIGQEGNLPKDRGLGLGLTLVGEDKAFTPLTVKNMVVKDANMQLGEDGPVVPKIPVSTPSGKTTSEHNRSIKGKNILVPNEAKPEEPHDLIPETTKAIEVEDKPENEPIEKIVEKTAEDIKDLLVPGHAAKKKDETAEVETKTEKVKELAVEVKKISGIGTNTAKDIGALYSDEKEMVKDLKDDKKHIPLRNDTVDLLKKRYLKE